MSNEDPIDLSDITLTMKDISSEIRYLEGLLSSAKSSMRLLEYHIKEFTKISLQMEERKRGLSA